VVCLSTTSTIYLQPYIEKIKWPYQLQAIEFKTELPGFSICIAGLEVVTSCYVTSCYNNSWSVFEICVWPLPMLAYLLSSASTSRIQDLSPLKDIFFFWKREILLISRSYIKMIQRLKTFPTYVRTAHSVSWRVS